MNIKQYSIRGRSNSEPISLENIGKRVREDVSFEESESTPPTKDERKKSLIKKNSGRLPLIGLNSYTTRYSGFLLQGEAGGTP